MQSEYGLAVAEVDDDFMAPSVTYTGDAVFLVVTLERRDSWLFVGLGPLVDGQVPPYPIDVTRSTPWGWFDLAMLMEVGGTRPLGRWPFRWRSPFRVPDPNDAEKLRARFLRVVELVRLHAGHLLAGDVAAFDELDTVLKARYLRD